MVGRGAAAVLSRPGRRGDDGRLRHRQPHAACRGTPRPTTTCCLMACAHWSAALLRHVELVHHTADAPAPSGLRADTRSIGEQGLAVRVLRDAAAGGYGGRWHAGGLVGVAPSCSTVCGGWLRHRLVVALVGVAPSCLTVCGGWLRHRLVVALEPTRTSPSLCPSVSTWYATSQGPHVGARAAALPVGAAGVEGLPRRAEGGGASAGGARGGGCGGAVEAEVGGGYDENIRFVSGHSGAAAH
jgi:hypothetical protein